MDLKMQDRAQMHRQVEAHETDDTRQVSRTRVYTGDTGPDIGDASSRYFT